MKKVLLIVLIIILAVAGIFGYKFYQTYKYSNVDAVIEVQKDTYIRKYLLEFGKVEPIGNKWEEYKKSIARELEGKVKYNVTFAEGYYISENGETVYYICPLEDGFYYFEYKEGFVSFINKNGIDLEIDDAPLYGGYYDNDKLRPMINKLRCSTLKYLLKNYNVKESDYEYTCK